VALWFGFHFTVTIGECIVAYHYDILPSRKMNALTEQIERGVQTLSFGGVIAFPTDTVYGLGANAFEPIAVERIYEIKKRPRHLSFPLLLADVSQITSVAQPMSEIAQFLTRRFLPGGLTLVLPKAASLPAYLASGSNVAVRVPNHPVPLALIRGLGKPIIGTSANISGEPPALTAGEVEQQFKGELDLIIDGGRCPGGMESTVVDVTGEAPVVLRQGIIPEHEIKEACRQYQKVKRIYLIE
jgi:L-threonylcarbamoyladenylate synthase